MQLWKCPTCQVYTRITHQKSIILHKIRSQKAFPPINGPRRNTKTIVWYHLKTCNKKLNSHFQTLKSIYGQKEMYRILRFPSSWRSPMIWQWTIPQHSHVQVRTMDSALVLSGPQTARAWGCRSYSDWSRCREEQRIGYVYKLAIIPCTAGTTTF